jgi:High potential iron-sulfur protein
MSAQLNRRSFLQITGASAIGIAVLAPNVLAATTAPAADLPNLELDNPTAKALGYVEDSSKADTAKYPSHKPDQLCSGCNFIQGDSAKARRPCSLFPGKSVSSKGWCVSWAKKA